MFRKRAPSVLALTPQNRLRCLRSTTTAPEFGPRPASKGVAHHRAYAKEVYRNTPKRFLIGRLE